MLLGVEVTIGTGILVATGPVATNFIGPAIVLSLLLASLAVCARALLRQVSGDAADLR